MLRPLFRVYVEALVVVAAPVEELHLGSVDEAISRCDATLDEDYFLVREDRLSGVVDEGVALFVVRLAAFGRADVRFNCDVPPWLQLTLLHEHTAHRHAPFVLLVIEGAIFCAFIDIEPLIELIRFPEGAHVCVVQTLLLRVGTVLHRHMARSRCGQDRIVQARPVLLPAERVRRVFILEIESDLLPHSCLSHKRAIARLVIVIQKQEYVQQG